MAENKLQNHSTLVLLRNGEIKMKEHLFNLQYEGSLKKSLIVLEIPKLKLIYNKKNPLTNKDPWLKIVQFEHFLFFHNPNCYNSNMGLRRFP